MNKTKSLKRKLVLSVVFRGYPKIVVASTGRSGSTMVFDAIADGLIKHRFSHPSGSFAKRIRRWCEGFVDSLSDLPKAHCVVCKTHDIFEPPAGLACKYVFIYGDPLDSAISVQQMFEQQGAAWVDQHLRQLKGSGAYEKLYEEDILNYQRQLETWLTSSRDDVICIDYDDLWDEAERLSRFLGFSVSFPARRSRTPKPKPDVVNEELFGRLRETKERLKQHYQIIAGSRQAAK